MSMDSNRVHWLAIPIICAVSLLLTPGATRAQQSEPVPLTPGKPVRIKITPEGSAGASPGTITIRISVEGNGTGGGGTGGGGSPPPETDQLTADLTSLYQSDTDAQKATHIQGLKQVYSWAANAVKDAQFTTVGTFRSALGDRSTQTLPTSVLLPFRQRVQKELRAVLPSQSSAQLDDATRTKASQLFEKLATIAGQLK